MQATIHVVYLIVLPLGALLALVALKRRMPTSRQLTIAFGLAAAGTLAAPIFNTHLCYEGRPRMQWMLLGPCLLMLLLFVRSAVWRRVLAAAIFVGMMGLSCHFTQLVHTPGWTGNPDWDGGIRVIFRSSRRSAVAIAAESEKPDVVLTEGWQRDLPVWADLKEIFGNQHPVRREVRKVWHTTLTGLYRYTVIPQDYWCPGGTFEEAMAGLELRDRPTQ